MNCIRNVINGAGLVVASLTLVSLPARAIDLSSSTGVWTGVNGGASVTGVGTNQVRWGNPATSNGKSGLGYVGSAPPTFSLPLDTNFILGQLTHYNFPIVGPASGATLQISLTFTNGGETITPTFSYGFNIDETTNAGSLAACDPAKQISTVPCDDIITPVDPQPQTFTLNNRQYQITIPGFSTNTDGSSALEKFTTVESTENDAYLVGRLTDITPSAVPWETDALSVVGTTILFAGGVWRKHKSRKKTLDKD
jgi:hypothetical protein